MQTFQATMYTRDKVTNGEKTAICEPLMPAHYKTQ